MKFYTYSVPTNWRWGEVSKAIDPEVVFPQDNLLESLVIEEHVDGAGVRLLPSVVLLVLHAPGRLRLEARVLVGWTHAGHEVCTSHKPGIFHSLILSNAFPGVHKLLIERRAMALPCSEILSA